MAHLASLTNLAGTGTWNLEFQGRVQQLQIYNVSLSLPKYRLANGRTVSAQHEWLALRPNEDKQLFVRDPELEKAQRTQHEILKSMIGGKELYPHFRKAEHKQVEPIILDSHGFVVNGNRRLCCWRELYDANKNVYAHFHSISVVILPPCDEEDIDRLEGALQVQPDIKDDYMWHSTANMYAMRMKQLNVNEDKIAEVYRTDRKEVRLLLDMLDEAKRWLEQTNQVGQWSKVSDKEYVFRPMVEKRQSLPNSGAKELYRASIFSLIEGEAEDGRRYERVKEVHKHLPKIRTALREEFALADQVSPSSDTLLGKGTQAVASDIALAKVVVATVDNRTRAGAIIDNIINEEREAERQRKRAEGVLDHLRRANASVVNALAATDKSTTREGVCEQIQEIEETLKELRKWAQGNGSRR